VLADHVLSEIEAIDRMYLNLYQPRLQHGAGIAAAPTLVAVLRGWQLAPRSDGRWR